MSHVNPSAAGIPMDGEGLFARPWLFSKSVAGLEGLPEADRPEIAFAGRSNTGKSTLFNALTRQRQLARASNSPGRTQELNYFHCAGVPLWLVDMPGYGFARAPKDKIETWTGLVASYLAGRATLARVFLLIDARHGLKPIDHEIAALLDRWGVVYQAVLTKADKLKPAELESASAAAEAALAAHPAAFPRIIATSAVTGEGIPELRAAIAEILAERSRVTAPSETARTRPPNRRTR